MRAKRAATGLAAAMIAVTFGGGVALADPDDSGTDPNSQMCPYPDVNNPYCTNFPDDHNQEGDRGNGHDEGDAGGHR
ncbi:hypothetical protein ACFXO9_33015 [Nocardia tengchongensis]|uniref:hypothetical protein n=1 Tax=Nocardia tengchongensis TaxID=2055889 RepID=UPI00340D5A9C